jgi:hypothetical protein
MADSSRDTFHVLPQYQPLMRIVGLDAEAVFTHPNVVAWRKLPDRENCTLDAERDERPVRFHIKRYPVATTLADDEVRAIELLREAAIATVPLVGWGKLADGRSFVITEDLAGYRDAEKLVAGGTIPFESLLDSTAALAARLHAAGLHHRDLYLCHFFARPEDPADLRLIDVARVAKLGGFFKGRWIVKDLAQFIYSTRPLDVSDAQRERWLVRYASARGIELTPRLRRAIERKVAAIARHDAKLKRARPTRNVSIPR